MIMKKMSVSLVVCLTIALSTFSIKIQAQALSADDIKAQLVKEWERAKNYTGQYLNTMPADKYSFKAVDSIRSFAQQMLHLAMANCFLMANATGQAPPSWLKESLEKSPTAQNKDSVTYYVNASYDFAANAVKATDPAKWGEKKKLFGMEETTFALMIKTFEHQTHHRGQTTIYIRLLGIRPPEEMLF